MRVAVLKECVSGEHRVGQVPETVARLLKSGVEVVLERCAGLAAGFDDSAFVVARLAEDAVSAVAGAEVSAGRSDQRVR